MQTLCSCEKVIEIGTMLENKRSPCSVDHSGFTSLALKRQKSDLSIPTKDKKDKVGERIVTLQQLVSPYGKTDTASVLLEAMEYIQFLHEQVKVLSAPYLQTGSLSNMQAIIKPNQDVEHYSLRSQGLCLVPISYTAGVAHSNGADIWAPIKTTSQKFDKAISPFN
ncbi:bHLH113 protein [Hibiscus syriacus]|uniref:BHLH113 protein n=1 Tax=Hibiscus syriacus TaxID=106335 RepID=A0A6A3BTR9_HIBSY|nr:transcription factor bHLH153-like isoform X2 [Hibiscus syriacus]KAE8718309.1 bHLH113 protein [Hibiscus syriacus]